MPNSMILNEAAQKGMNWNGEKIREVKKILEAEIS